MTDRFSDRILRFLDRPGYHPVKVRPLARLMGIAEEEYGEFRDAVDALRRLGRVVHGGGNALTLPEGRRTLVGTYRANPRGFGFVVPEDPDSHADLFIPPGKALDAITGDTVECAVEHPAVRPGRGRPAERTTSGRITRVVSRGHGQFVGELCLEAGRWFVRPDGNRLHVPIFVSDIGAKHARAGDQVVVEILTYPGEGRQATGVIVERLGARGQPGVDLLSIVRQHQLPGPFPPAVLADARSAIDRFDLDAELRRREDLRSETIATIDPDDARDFDDAISLRRLSVSGAAVSRRRGADRSPAWELGVHIADVSAFVRFGSALDAEARQRGNSVYFPRHVIPMLPEVLSNGLCSLQEDEPRLCKSAFVRYDAQGNVLSTRFANTVIRSQRRLTYREAQRIIDGRSGGYPREVVELLERMNELARVIQRRRLAAGQIVLALPEIELVFNDEYRVADAKPADDSFTHTIIEMFMIEANEAIARMLERRRLPFLRRVHPGPDEEAGESLGKFLRVAGHQIPRQLRREDIQKLLANLKGRPEEYAVNLAILKSMEQAVYSPKNEGHFALASECYTHFTSPIRRYTDLTIHRLLDEAIAEPAARSGGRGDRTRAPGGEPDLAALGRHLSFVERRAADAEREYRTLKILELLVDQVGERFEGVVTGVTNFGLFVQHPRFLVDGLVRFDAMPDDYWIVDAASGSVVGQRTRRRFSIGNVVKVQIAAVDLAARTLDLSMTPGSAERRPAPAVSRARPPRTAKAAARRETRRVGQQSWRRKFERRRR